MNDKMEAKAAALRDKIRLVKSERDASPAGPHRRDLDRYVKALQKDLRAYRYYRG